MKILKLLASVVLSTVLVFAPASAVAQKEIRGLRGFDKKVYDASLALYATSEKADIKEPRFICTVSVVGKNGDVYALLGAGHCTSANTKFYDDMKYYVADQIGEGVQSVELAGAVVDEPTDFALFTLRTSKKYPVIPLGDESEVALNDKTIDVNFSLGITKEVSYGRVVSKVIKNSACNNCAGFFEVEQFDSHGASGSAVISEKTHKVIGIVIAGIDGATVPSLVEPISRIKRSLSLHGFAEPESGQPMIVVIEN